MADVQDTISGIDAALGASQPQQAPDPSAAAPAPAAPPTPVQNTMAGIDAALQGAQPTGVTSPPADVPDDHEITVHASRKEPPAPAPAAADTSGSKPTWADVPGDMITGLGAGINRGVAALPGLPGTVSRFLDFAPAYIIAKGAEKLGLLPPGRTAADLYDDAKKLDYTPSTWTLPTSDQTTKMYEDLTGKLPTPKTVPGQLAETIGEFLPGSAGNIVTAGILPALVSETAGQVTKGTGLEPYARAAGGIVGGAAGLAAAGAGEAANVAKNALQEYRLPATQAGQEQLAGQRLQAAASDPTAVDRALTPGPMQPGAQPNYEALPGSEPTTFQVTGDLGLGQLERQARNATPEPFIARDAEQNAARVGAMQGVQVTGSPADVAAQFRAARDALDQKTQAQVAAITPAAQDANTAMGGYGTAEATGYAMRQPMADARAAAKVEENRLWGLVDQEGGVPTAGVAKMAKDVRSSVSPSATPLSGEEARIFGVASGYPQMQRFGDLKDLRSSITDAVAEAKQAGNTQTVRRLGLLRHAVDEALDHGVENQAAVEQVAVRRGLMSPENTLEAKLAAQRDEFLAQRTAVASGGTRDGSRSSGRSTSAPSGNGTIGQTGRGFAAHAGAEAISGQALSPFTPEDVANYRAATQSTRERASTYDEGVPGRILQPAGRGGYAMPDAAVPSAVIKDGSPNGAQAVRQFLAAGGTPDALADATALAVRQKAMLGDGTLDPNKVHGWLRRNADAIAEMPPEVAARFKTAADTQDAVNQMAARRKEALERFDKSALARIAGLQDSEDVVRHVGGVLGAKDSVAQMRQLATATSADPAARDGLRRALAEHMTQKLLSNTEAGTSGVQQLKADGFLTYLRQNAPALRQVFSPQEMDTFNAVGRDLQRANRSVVATKGNKSSPGTAQDLLKAPENSSILTKVLLEAGPAVVGKAAGGWTGAALGWLGSKVIARGRAAGLERVDALVTDALLNPSLARSLLAKVPTKADVGTAQSLGSKFAGIAAKAALGTYTSELGR